MNFNDYQLEARCSAIYPRIDTSGGLVYCALGLNGEAGEVAEHAKKMLRDDHGHLLPERKAEIEKELGDVLWYLANAAHEVGITLDDVATMNLAKLNVRYQIRDTMYRHGDDR